MCKGLFKADTVGLKIRDSNVYFPLYEPNLLEIPLTSFGMAAPSIPPHKLVDVGLDWGFF